MRTGTPEFNTSPLVRPVEMAMIWYNVTFATLTTASQPGKSNRRPDAAPGLHAGRSGGKSQPFCVSRSPKR
jgi:hypothetical protein